ncbi:hypothetical protein CY34DRAFT_811504 [Suillus luteus UH-Slu-Lm8-n1]|uniref:Uncharacterized protein n=1 Tax=Suillus luteus UH-Slu-Lm8-n1 TaxID=930992 RepID=A0A0D0AWB1_9AGAM|nr:hypothetical protein CY34DRAFT_811504 [Suillus luteus UH-Slu-Lm8-n1]
MAPSDSTASPTATSASSVDEPHKRAFPFAALILLALCIAYIVSYLVYRRILTSWNAKQNAEKVQNFPSEFFEKKPRGASDSLSATLRRAHRMMMITKDRLASHGARAYGRARLPEKTQSQRHMCITALLCGYLLK